MTDFDGAATEAAPEWAQEPPHPTASLDAGPHRELALDPDAESGVEYVIGVDLGDGESTLAWARVEDVPRISVYQRAATGERSIVTATARAPLDRRRLIGEEAVAATGATEFTLNFKAPPDRTGMDTPDSILFIQTLLSEFLQATQEIAPDRALLIVGHPTGWDEEAVAAYRRHLSALTIPLRVLPESQAALIHVRGVPERGERLGAEGPVGPWHGSDGVGGPGTESEPHQGTLVVDIGSSTTDFTFVVDMKPANLALGADLGCRAIDHQVAGLVAEAFRDQPELTATLSQDGGREFLLLACRRAKEAQFAGTSPRIIDQHINDRFRPIVDLTWGWLKAVPIPELVMAHGGWADQFRDLLRAAADELHGRFPARVVLTGGGSRMPVVRQLCAEVMPRAILDQDPEPSLSVARGLTLAGLHQVRVARFKESVARELAAEDITRVCVNSITDAFIALRAECVTNFGRGKIEVRQGQYIVTTSGSPLVLKQLGTRLGDLLQPRIDAICQMYHVVKGVLDLTFSVPLTLTEQIVEPLTQYMTGSNVRQAAMRTSGERALNAARLRRTSSGRTNQLELAIQLFEFGAYAIQAGREKAAAAVFKREIRTLSLSAAEISAITQGIRAHIIAELFSRVAEIEQLIY